ncbi:GNAT family N-acetyltransferase [Haloprofundus halobius]|uniref:GNAT family N-acetyltransferase n=1 Tax=Haloprofundus halobius TaxID=2876194 RepID=UPI001CC994B7|nr:GNAT family N-acetyltransferase [Haloprofundus halobius]
MTDLIPLSRRSPALDAAVSLYWDLYGEAERGWGSRAEAATQFERHAEYPGYRGFAAVEDDEVLGFVYGYTSAPGQFYHDQLATALGPERTERWLRNCFEFVELAVAEDARRRGLGTSLHDSVLDGLSHETSVLTTGVDNDPARALYEREGWQTVHDAFELNEGNPMVVMARELPDGESTSLVEVAEVSETAKTTETAETAETAEAGATTETPRKTGEPRRFGGD